MVCSAMGTTSACAENTTFGQAWRPFERNYLRVRGEYMIAHIRANLLRELPPRARRIQQLGEGGMVGGGTTSACAENTGPHHDQYQVTGNYLRVRGEYYGVAR